LNWTFSAASSKLAPQASTAASTPPLSLTYKAAWLRVDNF
jgi:hypothetical protein